MFQTDSTGTRKAIRVRREEGSEERGGGKKMERLKK